MSKLTPNFPEHFDDVDKEIYHYLSSDVPSSFLLFAGAGSGKTRTLVNVLELIKKSDIQKYTYTGGKVAVITYTNAACDEIKHRLNYDPAFSVSTIHSFAWELIKPFNEDIRNFLKVRLLEQIQDLKLKISKAKDINGITAQRNIRSLDSKEKRLEKIDSIVEFSYSPAGGRPERDALNHPEVIAMAAQFISEQSLMQSLLINRFPLLLIDESQDTNKDFITALIKVQQANKSKFALGLFGDMMQRIYGGGKEDLDKTPPDWKKPAKYINYRSPKRIINLVNAIRKEVDGIEQKPRENASIGAVRLFIVRSDVADKKTVEDAVRLEMSKITRDEEWIETNGVKNLILEHAMAAERGNFDSFFLPLARNQKLRDSVLDGTSSEISFILNQIIPLVQAINTNDAFEIARIVKNGNNFLNKLETSENPISFLGEADKNIEKVKAQLSEKDLTIRELLLLISDYNLLELPEMLQLAIQATISSDEEEETKPDELVAWVKAMRATITQIEAYSDYVIQESGFGTHQGVKGLEFDRVMAILDDESAGGFLFKYEKLLGAEPLSPTDLKNQKDGKDSTPLRTRRLFYVICSRAEKSLAIVAYTKNPQAVRKYALESWFTDNEVILI